MGNPAKNFTAAELHLLLFWRDYCAAAGHPGATVASCHHQNNDISIEHKIVAQRLEQLWEFSSDNQLADAWEVFAAVQDTPAPPAQPMGSTDVTIEHSRWDLAGNPHAGEDADEKSLLQTALSVNGTKMVLNAIEVTGGEVFEQNARLRDEQKRLETLQNMEMGDFQTTEVDGRQYVLFATPKQK